ncbi:hypothetical protein [Flavobacterium beibuense]|uniref:Lipocalin-like domain-containing protein n=1 Tax=Flavobacterium beibuense TaxID=657326 RepID=A0A444W6H0_9FLAO|nr:hypothetical protein [Flavobacterium beibuense]RYJ41459.1 hypothetical protein NU09_2833 [Flavobacterium beibuense]
MKNITFILLLFSLASFAQTDYVLPNEEAVFSFQTEKGKQMMLAKDVDDEYMVYRFGTVNKIELESKREKTADGFSGFKYSGYARHGGPENEGMMLDYLAFTNGDYKYVIYKTYYSVPDETAAGVKVYSLKSDELITDIKADNVTVKGTIHIFRDNGLISYDEENILYD